MFEYQTIVKHAAEVGAEKAMTPTPPEGEMWSLVSASALDGAIFIYWWKRPSQDSDALPDEFDKELWEFERLLSDKADIQLLMQAVAFLVQEIGATPFVNALAGELQGRAVLPYAEHLLAPGLAQFDRGEAIMIATTPFTTLDKSQPETNRGSTGAWSLQDIPKAAFAEGLKLTAEKRKHPTKHYRLTYLIFGKPVLCAEDQKHYKKVHGEGGILEAGEALAKELGVTFDGRVR